MIESLLGMSMFTRNFSSTSKQIQNLRLEEICKQEWDNSINRVPYQNYYNLLYEMNFCLVNYMCYDKNVFKSYHHIHIWNKYFCQFIIFRFFKKNFLKNDMRFNEKTNFLRISNQDAQICYFYNYLPILVDAKSTVKGMSLLHHYMYCSIRNHINIPSELFEMKNLICTDMNSSHTLHIWIIVPV